MIHDIRSAGDQVDHPGREPCLSRQLDLSQRARVELFDGVSVDLRTGGHGQIACEPSIHPNGFAYSWEQELPLDLAQLPELPDGIVARLRQSKEQRTSPLTEAVWRKGDQHNKLVSMAGTLRKAGPSLGSL